MPRRSSIFSAALVSASLMLAPLPSLAAPEPEPGAQTPIEGPARPDPDNDPGTGPGTGPGTDPDGTSTPAPEPAHDVLKPSFDPPVEAEPGIEFAVPPPEAEAKPKPKPELTASFPDPGTAPNDGRSMLVLSGTTIGLTLVGFSTGLVIGLRNRVPLEWLLPSTIIPTAGLLAFAGGGLYLGIKRARSYRRWEIGYRVIGTPQGGGLKIGGSFALLAALGLIPSGAFALQNGQTNTGATLIAIGSAAAVATPIMFIIGGKRQRDYQRTGGWRRKVIPPLPPGAEGARLKFAPLVAPLPGGLILGAVGQF